MNATFTKLRNGDWGLRVEGGVPAAGMSIVVSKKGGTSARKTVGKVVWTGNGVTICTIEAEAPKAAPLQDPRGANGRCDGCRGPIRNAAHHRAMNGLCGSCAFDVYDC